MNQPQPHEPHTCSTCRSLLPDAQKLARRVAGLPPGHYVIMVAKAKKGVWWEVLLPYGDQVESGK